MSWEIGDEYDELPEVQELEPGWISEMQELEPGVVSEHIGHECAQEAVELLGESEIVGEPLEDAELWHMQHSETTCAVVSQEFVAENFLNKEFSEEELVEFAEANGWYENGTPPEYAGKILEALGIPVEREYDASLNDLEQVLESGGKAMVGVHNAVLANPELAAFPWLSANHMVQVTGIDRTDPQQVKIILNDPGVPDGAGAEHLWNDFEKAWATSGHYLVSAYRPAEGGIAV